MRPRFSLRMLLIMVTLCALGLAIPYWIPKSEPLSIHASYLGSYRGLGLHDGRGYFGKNWYRVVVHEDAEGYWEVDVKGLGFNRYRGYYSNGVLREEGMCMVSQNAADIAPDRSDLLQGKFYDPQGNLISEVRNGTGKQVICGADGTRIWELELVNGERTRLIMRYANGQLMSEPISKNAKGHSHGPVVGYHSNGQVKYRGQYSDGELAGVWRFYRDDGTLDLETTFDAKATE